MIQSKDRSYYFGASDTDKIIGKRSSDSWLKWWMQKLGINQDHFDNMYTKAGTNWEHRILDSLNLPNLEKDRQFIIEDLRLRVNLDGNLPNRIEEVKTYQWEKGWKKTPQKTSRKQCSQEHSSQLQESSEKTASSVLKRKLMQLLCIRMSCNL